jgi:predicted Rossmann-fold nucleotide-binding protein
MTACERKERSRAEAFHRRRIVGVMGSGTDAFRDFAPSAARLGRWIAQRGYDLLTGGGPGLMAVVCRAFFETSQRRGLVIGIIPGSVPALGALERRDDELVRPVAYDVEDGYPNRWVELAIYTHLPHSGAWGTSRLSRNHINVLSSDVVVALPGGEGTQSEIWLARQYGVPVIAFHPADVDLPVPVDVPKTAVLEEVAAFVDRHMP